MHKQSRKSLEPVLSQLDTAAAVLMALRWAIDRTLVDEDLDALVAIARAMMPAARAALECTIESPVESHVRAALDALSYVEWLVNPELPEAGFDRLIAIADPSIERCQIAIDAAQAQIRKKTRRVSRSARESLRRRRVEDSSMATADEIAAVLGPTERPDHGRTIAH